jgi:AbrB family looped-hinge helix DNA binding protein
MTTTSVGKEGMVSLPREVLSRLGIAEGTRLTVEVQDDSILLRPVSDDLIELYTPERKAEFLLSTALDAADYAAAVDEVRRMGLDPERIPHYRPPAAEAAAITDRT